MCRGVGLIGWLCVFGKARVGMLCHVLVLFCGDGWRQLPRLSMLGLTREAQHLEQRKLCVVFSFEKRVARDWTWQAVDEQT